jgi:hypothetical protein
VLLWMRTTVRNRVFSWATLTTLANTTIAIATAPLLFRVASAGTGSRPRRKSVCMRTRDDGFERSG